MVLIDNFYKFLEIFNLATKLLD